ncbi:MAG: YceI family protein, partial [Xanthomonadales bacterium]|nr:YceI family protein [Xanthomonadales bacterium]
KKSSMAEVHHFKKLTGGIDTKGYVAINVDLNSIETNIPIRNERMQSMLFETNEFPVAKISSITDVLFVNDTPDSTIVKKQVEFNLNLHGINKKISTEVLVTKVSKNKFTVHSLRPIIINSVDYNLSEGITKLQEAAKLPSIATSVPVNFTLVFSKRFE